MRRLLQIALMLGQVKDYQQQAHLASQKESVNGKSKDSEEGESCVLVGVHCLPVPAAAAVVPEPASEANLCSWDERGGTGWFPLLQATSISSTSTLLHL